jgi:hypothetical protein
MGDRTSRPAVASFGSAVVLLATLALGVAAGAMLAEGAVLVPWWRSMPPEGFLRWYADNARRLLEFYGPLEIVSATLTLLAAVVHRPARRWFVGAALLALAVLASFPIYFRDVNASFETGAIGVDRLPAELGRWAAWHWGRTMLGLLAFALALLGVRADERR